MSEPEFAGLRPNIRAWVMGDRNNKILVAHIRVAQISHVLLLCILGAVLLLSVF